MTKIAAGLQLTIAFLLCLKAVVPDHVNTERGNEFPTSEDLKKKPSAPDLLSQIGGMILDADEAVWKQTQPLRNIEAKFVENTLKGAIKPPSEYISRIRDNYREMQKRIGSTLLSPLVALSSESNDPKNGPQLNPVFDNLQQFVRKTSESLSSGSTKRSGDDADPRDAVNPVEDILSQLNFPDIDGKFSVGGTVVRFHNKDSGASLNVDRKPDSPVYNFQKRSGEMDELDESKSDLNLMDTTEDFNFLPGEDERERPSSFTTEDLENFLSKGIVNRDPRPAEYEMRFNVGPNLARIGDIRELSKELYLSIMKNERYRRVLRNHVVNWIFDPDVDPESPVMKKLQKVRLATRDMVSNKNSGNPKHNREYGYDYFQKRQGSVDELYDHDYDDFPPPSSYYYDVVNSQDMRKEIERSGMMHDDASDSYDHDGEYWPNRYQTIVLAFTPEGVPLKLGMDPTIQYPIKYLRRVLSESGVYLNVPVDSTGTRHAGREIIQLGMVEGMQVEDPLYVDMTDLDQQRVLLSSLRTNVMQHREAEVEMAYEDALG